MSHKLLFLLNELKSNFSMTLLRQTLNSLEEETTINDLYKEFDEFTKLLNGQSQQFYRELAYSFVSDLNDNPLLYFIIWEPIINFFDDLTQQKFFRLSLELSGSTDATDYVNGLSNLKQDKPEIALFHFNRVTHLTVCYFLGICYLEIENFENSIKQNQQFLKYINDLEAAEGTEILMEDYGIVLARWHVYGDLGYCFNRLGDYKAAVMAYEKSLEFLSLEESYLSKKEVIIADNLDEFQLFANNYLLALERSGHVRKCLDIVDFIIEHYPKAPYYKKLKIRLSSKFESKSFSEEVIQSIFKPKKPFGLASFQEVKLLSKEKALEDMIIEQIKYGYKVFGKELEVYQNDQMYGRQYRLYDINGILDLLLIEKSTNQLYVVELKRDSAGLEVVEQISGYITSVAKEFGLPVKGIICAHRASKELVQELDKHKFIELYSYHFDFIKLS